MNNKSEQNFINKRCIILCVLIAFVMISLSTSTYAASDPIEVNIISSTQVIPGTLMKVRVSIFNNQDISPFQIQSMNIAEKTKNINNIITEDKKFVIVDAISYEKPVQPTKNITTSNQVTISKPKQEKKLVNKKLAPIGDALKLKDDLRNEFYNKIKTENLSDVQIKSYVDLENDLKKIIQDGKSSIVLEVPVPADFPERTTLTIPINISYSTESLSTQTFSTFATVMVTSNPVPKRAIIIDIDGAKRDALYNSLAYMPNMTTIVNDGVKFTDAKTVFPSITLATQASIFTGNYPGKHEIAGNEWFEKSSINYHEYGIGIYLGKGDANLDLSTNVKTIYEAAKNDKSMNSTVIFNQYNRLNNDKTKWIIPGADELNYQYYTLEYDKVDSNAMKYALEELNEYLPDIITIYFSGIDSYSHLYGSIFQEYFFINYVDNEIGRLLDGLNGLGIKDETLIVIVSDHGQTSVIDDDIHAISKTELEEVLKNSGYDIDDVPVFEGSYNAVAAPNGGMAQIYIGDLATSDWNVEIDFFDLQSALIAFKSKPYVDVILFRWSKNSGYWVYTGSGNIQDLQTFFAGKPNYIDAVNRINGLDSKRSGDIILLAKDSFYFASPTVLPPDDGLFKGEHGGLSPDESYIPLIFSGRTIKKGETDSTPAKTIDMATTLADLLGFSIPNAEGIVLPVKQRYVPVAVCGTDKLRCENVGSPVQFNGLESYDSDGAIVSYYWDFGDGTNVTDSAPKHTYSAYKRNDTAYESFMVNLTVTDDGGLTNSTSQKVVIWMAGDANGDGTVNILDASVVGLKWGGNDPCGDLNNDGSVNILDASIIGVNWGKGP